MFDYWYTLKWLFRLVHTNESSLSLCVSSRHLCRVMCTNEVGMSLEVVHTILSIFYYLLFIIFYYLLFIIYYLLFIILLFIIFYKSRPTYQVEKN